MKKQQKSILEKVSRADYSVEGEGECPHSPSMTIRNLKRLDRIRDKMRKAGVTEAEIDFFVDFYQADALHVFKLSAANESFEAKQRSVN